MCEIIAECLKYKLNECHVRHVTYVAGEMEKIRITLAVFFFKMEKKNKDKTLISIKMLLFFKTIMASFANVPAASVSSCLWQWILPEFLFLKHQDYVMQETKYSLQIKRIYKECNNLKIRSPLNLPPPSDVLQQTIKLK